MSQTMRPLNECIKLPSGIDKALAKRLLAFSCITGTAMAAIVAGSHAGLKHEQQDQWAKFQKLFIPATTAGVNEDAKRALSPLTANERLRAGMAHYFGLAGRAVGFASSITLLQILLYKSLSKQGSTKHFKAVQAALRVLTLVTSSMGLASLLRYLLQKPLALLLGKNALEPLSVGVQQGDKKLSYELCTPVGALSTLAAAGLALHTQGSRRWWLQNILAFGSSFETIAKSDDTQFASTMMRLALPGLNDVFMVNFSHRFFGNNIMTTLARGLDYATIKFPWDNLRKPTAFAMLGLGDIVIPGGLASLALRFDRAISSGNKQDPLSFDSNGYEVPAYFVASLSGYTAGLLGAISAYQRTGKAQPALAYLVPGTMLPVLGLAWYRGELGRLFGYDASKDVAAAGEEEE